MCKVGPMPKFLQVFSISVAVLFQARIMAVMLKGPWRTFPFLFVYLIVSSVSNVFPMVAAWEGRWTRTSAAAFWISEVVANAAIFACLLHLLVQVLRAQEKVVPIHSILTGALVFGLLAAWHSHHASLNKWMTTLDRDLSFGVVLLNLALWTALARKPIRQHLLISAGFGLQLAGAAMGHAFRQMAPNLVGLGDTVLTISYFLGIGVLWRAFQPAPGGGPVKIPGPDMPNPHPAGD